MPERKADERLTAAQRHDLTADESAELKQALKHDPITVELRRMAAENPVEADEAVLECEQGYDTYSPDSWVAEVVA